mmetsp:Transcript_27828/g.90512  ORF Transcript_27828/g.90512 Transcript_27828/m.90512 type:complete len:339 (+) Transcript_27828:363-1379(+)
MYSECSRSMSASSLRQLAVITSTSAHNCSLVLNFHSFSTDLLVLREELLVLLAVCAEPVGKYLGVLEPFTDQQQSSAQSLQLHSPIHLRDEVHVRPVVLHAPADLDALGLCPLGNHLDVVDADPGAAVHLQQPRLALLIQHDVKPQQVEAARPPGVRGPCQAWVPCLELVDTLTQGGPEEETGLLYQVMDLFPYRLRVVPQPGDLLEDVADRPFGGVPLLFLPPLPSRGLPVTLQLHVGVVRSDESIAQLVETVVGQVARHFAQVSGVGQMILVRAEPCQALVADPDVQRLYGSDQHVHPEVELEAVEQQGAIDVSLSYQISFRRGGDPLHEVLVAGH